MDSWDFTVHFLLAIVGLALLAAVLWGSVRAYRKWGHHLSHVRKHRPESNTSMLIAGLVLLELVLLLKLGSVFFNPRILAINAVVVLALVLLGMKKLEGNKRMFFGAALTALGIILLGFSFGPTIRFQTPTSGTQLASWTYGSSTYNSSNCSVPMHAYRFDTKEPSTPINPGGVCRVRVSLAGHCVYMRSIGKPKPILVCPGNAPPDDVSSVWSAEEPFESAIGLVHRLDEPGPPVDKKMAAR